MAKPPVVSTSSVKRILPIDEPIDISRDQMTMLMMESFKKCSTSAEEILCLREVAKMNGLYEKNETTHVNIHYIEQNIRKLETLPDNELLKLAGHSSKLFEQSAGNQDPSDQPIEADFEEISNDD
jgi:hypothetical protein